MSQIKGVILLEKLIYLSLLSVCIPVFLMSSIQFSKQLSVLREHQKKISTIKNVFFRLFSDTMSVHSLLSVSPIKTVFRLNNGKILIINFENGQLKRNYNQHVMNVTPPLFFEEYGFELKDNKLWCINLKPHSLPTFKSCFNSQNWRSLK
tara:strand:- start:1032 stop:1481 length:450 start_codon:yes stop_codon:yes gene_type:complete